MDAVSVKPPSCSGVSIDMCMRGRGEMYEAGCEAHIVVVVVVVMLFACLL